MKKVFFAIGCRDFENVLHKKINALGLEVVGDTVYKEGIIPGIRSQNPNIIIIRETLDGQTSIMDIIYELRCNHSNVRIIFISKNDRKVGDALLSALVSYGVYDIILGENTSIDEIISLLVKPNKINDVMYLQPKIKVDEKTTNVLFEAPEQTQKVEVIKYIDNTKIEDNKQQTPNKANLKVNKLDDLQFEKVNIPKDKQNVEKEPFDSKNSIDGLSIDKLDNFEFQEVGNTEIDSAKKQKEILEKAEREREKAVLRAREEAKKEAERKINNQNKIIDKEKKEKEEALKQLQQLKENTLTVSNKQKIISFVGAKHGCGNTQIAFNTALDLALEGKKVMYLEISNAISTVAYIYQIYNIENGLETAINGIKNDRYNKIDDSIINLGSLINNVDKNHVLYKSYKKLPKTLDVMFVSERYIQTNNYLKTEDFDKDLLKQLYLYIMYQKSYDVLIIDISGDVNLDVLYTSVNYSNKVFFTITQDVSTISQAIYRINLMNKKRINLKEKIYYILNRFDNKAKLGVDDIKEWLGERIDCNIVSLIEDYNKYFIDSNYIGMPILLNSPNRNIRQAFYQIKNEINK